jgi:hypothetical protein
VVQAHPLFLTRLKNTGLRLLQSSLPQLNKCLISAFVERWQPETSSFHLPFGEMTITLDDVKQITGLPIEGEMLSSVGFDNNDKGSDLVARIDRGVDLVERTLGIDPSEVRMEFKANNDQLCVRLTWLRQLFGKRKWVTKNAIPDSGNEASGDEAQPSSADIDYAVRGYLLHSFGCNLFADKSGSRVSILYLKYLEDLDNVNQYAWGASCLSFLYKALSDASRHNVVQIMGYLALLEVFTYI